MRTMLQPHQDWLTVVQMPAYAPDLNPVEGAWSNMKNGLGNLGSCSTPHRLAFSPGAWLSPARSVRRLRVARPLTAAGAPIPAGRPGCPPPGNRIRRYQRRMIL
jgi:DDE superfamily endonuclease